MVLTTLTKLIAIHGSLLINTTILSWSLCSQGKIFGRVKISIFIEIQKQPELSAYVRFRAFGKWSPDESVHTQKARVFLNFYKNTYFHSAKKFPWEHKDQDRMVVDNFLRARFRILFFLFVAIQQNIRLFDFQSCMVFCKMTAWILLLH